MARYLVEVGMLSVLTLVHGRGQHLANLIRGLEQSEVAPDELVIVHMNEAAVHRESPRFPIIAKTLDAKRALLPLAAARNAAAATARADHLIFLDVDCIPAPTLVAEHRASLLHDPSAIHQGSVRYLPHPIDFSAETTDSLRKRSSVHPLHADRIAGGSIPYPLFWSLNFSCHRDTFYRVGGFDAAYQGYGGEDTDFIFSARKKRIRLLASAALAFHQHHASYDPPLNHFADIVENARRFREKWHEWPMLGWLNAFEARGYIRVRSADIDVHRTPTADEIAACRCSEAAF